MHNNSQLILASASPRRRLLLSGVDLIPEIVSVDMDETPHLGEDPTVYVRRMAESKASLCRERIGKRKGIIVAGDTTVTIDGKILGKPESPEDALRILTTLSGRAHHVITGWATVDESGDMHSGTESAQIVFRPLERSELEDYIATGEPMDKAGAYGIQGLGGQLVEHYQGRFDTIVGLPVQTVLADLSHRGMIGLSQLGIRLAVIRGRVAAAAHETGRVVEDITVVGATKAQGQSVLKDAYTSGLRDFGESYVQELVGRTDIGDGLRYHFIGRIQRNKVARIIQHVARIHTLDSPRVADTVDRLAGENGLSVRCLVQVNIAREESKAGVDPAECAALLNHTRGLENVTVDGLMALPPRSGFSESRLWFRRLREMRDSLQADGHVLPHLSMGMSDDFDSAVAEGSTFIRVGSALFGPRQTT